MSNTSNRMLTILLLWKDSQTPDSEIINTAKTEAKTWGFLAYRATNRVGQPREDVSNIFGHKALLMKLAQSTGLATPTTTVTTSHTHSAISIASPCCPVTAWGEGGEETPVADAYQQHTLWVPDP